MLIIFLMSLLFIGISVKGEEHWQEQEGTQIVKRYMRLSWSEFQNEYDIEPLYYRKGGLFDVMGDYRCMKIESFFSGWILDEVTIGTPMKELELLLGKALFCNEGGTLYIKIGTYGAHDETYFYRVELDGLKERYLGKMMNY